MTRRKLKLKQASAVLQVRPKDLQNLVQFGVVKPQRLAGAHFFDKKTLLAAKVALYLKESLGTSTDVLSRLMDAFSSSQTKFATQSPNYVVFHCRLTAKEEPIKLGVPFRALEQQVNERLNHVDLFKDLPRGRKRRGWKNEFLESLSQAARDLGEISEDEILRTVRSYRKEKRAPEITVAAET